MKASAILWGILFILTAAFYLVWSTWFMFAYWSIIQSTTLLALFSIMMYVLSILVGLIYVAAAGRCFYNAKTGDIGISKGIKIFGLASIAAAAIVILLQIFVF